MYQRILIASCLASAACTAKPSRLEEISEKNEAAGLSAGTPPDDPLPPAPALSRHAVTLAAPPAGIDDRLWREIGWFPADTTDIGGFTDSTSESLARSAADEWGGKFAECRPVFASIERTYTVWQAGRVNATSVYYGAMTRAQERECLQAALGAFGATGGQRGDLTIVSTPDGAWPRLAWFGRDEGTVVIREGDVPLEEWIKPAGSLADRPALVRLVAAVDRSQGMWSVGLRDYGTAFTGVASTGYMLVMTTPATRGERFFMASGQLEFASPEAAKQAESGAAAFAREVPSAADLGVVLTVKAEGTWLRSEITADTSKTDNAAITAWLQQVLARSRANGV